MIATSPHVARLAPGGKGGAAGSSTSAGAGSASAAASPTGATARTKRSRAWTVFTAPTVPGPGYFASFAATAGNLPYAPLGDREFARTLRQPAVSPLLLLRDADFLVLRLAE